MALDFEQRSAAPFFHGSLQAVLFKLLPAIRSGFGNSVRVQHQHVARLQSQFPYLEVCIAKHAQGETPFIQPATAARSDDYGRQVARIHKAKAAVWGAP